MCMVQSRPRSPPPRPLRRYSPLPTTSDRGRSTVTTRSRSPSPPRPPRRLSPRRGPNSDLYPFMETGAARTIFIGNLDSEITVRFHSCILHADVIECVIGPSGGSVVVKVCSFAHSPIIYRFFLNPMFGLMDEPLNVSSRRKRSCGGSSIASVPSMLWTSN